MLKHDGESFQRPGGQLLHQILHFWIQHLVLGKRSLTFIICASPHAARNGHYHIQPSAERRPQLVRLILAPRSFIYMFGGKWGRSGPSVRLCVIIIWYPVCPEETAAGQLTARRDNRLFFRWTDESWAAPGCSLSFILHMHPAPPALTTHLFFFFFTWLCRLHSDMTSYTVKQWCHLSQVHLKPWRLVH